MPQVSPSLRMRLRFRRESLTILIHVTPVRRRTQTTTFRVHSPPRVLGIDGLDVESGVGPGIGDGGNPGVGEGVDLVVGDGMDPGEGDGVGGHVTMGSWQLNPLLPHLYGSS